MIDIAVFIVGTYQAAGSFWDGFGTIAQHMKDANLTMDALRAMALDQGGVEGLRGLTQLDPEVIIQKLEFYGLGLPQEWNLAHFTDGAA